MVFEKSLSLLCCLRQSRLSPTARLTGARRRNTSWSQSQPMQSGACFCVLLWLQTIRNSASIKTIGDSAFSECTFAAIKIPKSVASFGFNPFTKCENQKELDVSESNFVFEGGGGDGQGENSGCLLPSLKTGDSSIPNTVIAICTSEFCGCNKLASITFPDSVKETGDEAFSCCYALESTVIPGSIETMGACPFIWSSKLLEIVIPGE